MNTNWRCPYCHHFVTLQTENIASGTFDFENGNKDGRMRLLTFVMVCPNAECKEYRIDVQLNKWVKNGGGGHFVSSEFFKNWTVKPQSNAKPIPDYVPSPICEDYKEACAILVLSPKASATLSRRCLQGMIRDYWKESRDRLVDEIQAIKDKVEPQTWAAIDAVRNIGNIGAHMEKDINVIVDVEPEEAALLSHLIEQLVEDWYVRRHEREKQLASIVAIAQMKKIQKQSPAFVAPPAIPKP